MNLNLNILNNAYSNTDYNFDIHDYIDECVALEEMITFQYNFNKQINAFSSLLTIQDHIDKYGYTKQLSDLIGYSQQSIGETIKNGWKRFVKWIKGIWQKICDFFSRIFGKNRAKQEKENVVKTIQGYINNLKSLKTQSLNLPASAYDMDLYETMTELYDVMESIGNIRGNIGFIITKNKNVLSVIEESIHKMKNYHAEENAKNNNGREIRVTHDEVKSKHHHQADKVRCEKFLNEFLQTYVITYNVMSDIIGPEITKINPIIKQLNVDSDPIKNQKKINQLILYLKIDKSSKINVMIDGQYYDTKGQIMVDDLTEKSTGKEYTDSVSKEFDTKKLSEKIQIIQKIFSQLIKLCRSCSQIMMTIKSHILIELNKVFGKLGNNVPIVWKKFTVPKNIKDKIEKAYIESLAKTKEYQRGSKTPKLTVTYLLVGNTYAVADAASGGFNLIIRDKAHSTTVNGKELLVDVVAVPKQALIYIDINCLKGMGKKVSQNKNAKYEESSKLLSVGSGGYGAPISIQYPDFEQIQILYRTFLHECSHNFDTNMGTPRIEILSGTKNEMDQQKQYGHGDRYGQTNAEYRSGIYDITKDDLQWFGKCIKQWITEYNSKLKK